MIPTLVLVSPEALAHIKWLVDFDLRDPPRPMGLVLTERFWMLLAAASIGLFAAYVVDIVWSRRHRFDWLEQRFSGHQDIVTNRVRICVGVLFSALWIIGHVILTPELISDWRFLPYLHFLTALCVLFEATLIVSAAGIVMLYARGVMEYGLHHMLDYAFLLGIAAHLAITWSGKERLQQHRLPLLIGSLMFSFLWAAIEKFGCPQWFDPFLDGNEALMMGLPRDIFLMCAAFVELTLVYLMLTGRNMVVVGALALNLLLIAGAVHFGKVDTIGHFAIIVILAILASKGSSAFRLLTYSDGRGVLQQAGIMMLGYWSALALMFALYYGVHRLLYATACP
jgi:hypothetical protein